MIVLTHLRIRNFKSLREVDLAFPPRASILIEGLNEAGKSTLFEAVYFALYGEPLLAEETGTTGRGQNASVINYQADQTTVVLGLALDHTRLEVERTLYRGRSATAQLLITPADQAGEEVRGVRAVNSRLLEEMGRLDKEALLNSCFVEQKKLARLEELRSEDRRTALECLLNLEKLQTLRGLFRPAPEDQQTLTAAEQRLALAHIVAAIPPAEQALALTRQRRAAVAMHEALAERATSLAQGAEAQQGRSLLAAERGALQAVLAEIDRLTTLQGQLRDLRDQRAALDRAQDQITTQQETLAEWDRQEREELPRLRARLAALEGLAADLTQRDEWANACTSADHAVAVDEQGLAQIAEHQAAATKHQAHVADLARQITAATAALTTDEAAARAAVQAGEAQVTALAALQTLLDRQAVQARNLSAARQAVEQTRSQAEEYAALQAQVADLAAGQAQQRTAVGEAETAYTTARTVADRFLDLVTTRQEAERAHTAAHAAAAAAQTDRAGYERLRDALAEAEQAAQAAAAEEEQAMAALTAAEGQQAVQQTVAALRRWVAAQRANSALTQHEAQSTAGAVAVATAEQKATTATATLAATRSRLSLLLAGGGLALLVGLGLFALGQGLLIAGLLVPIGLLALALAGWTATQLGPARRAADAAALARDAARQHALQRTADRRAAETMGGGAAALAEATAELRRLGADVPHDESAAEAQLTALAVSTEPPAAADPTTLRAALALVRQQRSEASGRAAMLRGQLTDHPGTADPAPRIEAAALQATALADSQARLVAARATLSEIDPALPGLDVPDGDRVPLLKAAVDGRQQALTAQQAQVTATEARHTLLAEQLARHPGADAAARLTAQNQQVSQLIGEQTALQEELVAGAAECGLDPTPEAVQAARAALDQHLATHRATLAALPARRETLAHLQQLHDTAAAAWTAEQAWLTAHPQEAAARALADHRQEAAAAADRYQAQVAQVDAAAAALNLPAAVTAVQQALGAARQAHENLQTTLTEKRPRLAAEHATGLAHIAADQARFTEGWRALCPLPAPLPTSTTDFPATPGLQTVAEAVTARITELDARGVRARVDVIGQEEATLAAAETQATTARIAAENELRRLLTTQGVAADLTADAIRAAYPVFAEVSVQDAVRYQEEEQEQERQLRNLRQQRDEGAARLGVDVATLDWAVCQAAVQAARHEIAVKARAFQMVEAVRRRMIDKVIPSTTHNLCQLLPLLTAGRYRDCQLTGDYKLQIWDEGAGRYVAKNIFSGGTRDQFSLALRLAFALATLPEELGTTPGFIFLDEPLSSFDGPRTEALVRLLTGGVVADSFHQIFVISHNRMFDRQAFTHHVTLENGRVAEHDLQKLPYPANNGSAAVAGLRS